MDFSPKFGGDDLDIKRGKLATMMGKFAPWKFPLYCTLYEKRGTMLPKVSLDRLGVMKTKQGKVYYATQKFKYALPPAPREMIEIWGNKQHVNLLSTEQNVFRYFRYDFNTEETQALYTETFKPGELKEGDLEVHKVPAKPLALDTDGKVKEISILRSVFSPEDRRFELDMIKHNESYDARRPKEEKKWYNASVAIIISIGFAFFLMYYGYNAYLGKANADLATSMKDTWTGAILSLDESIKIQNGNFDRWLNATLTGPLPGEPYIPPPNR